jgi:hypothetical protein
VWCWDNNKISADIVKQGHNPRNFHTIPETLLQPPENNGLRLIKCLEGVEGQYWRDAELIACRWWATVPDEQAWVSFQRDCSIPVALQQTSTSLVQHPFLRTPWASITRVRLTDAEDEISLREIAFYAALILCFGLFSVYFCVGNYQISKALSQTHQQVVTIKKKAAAIFAAREEALNASSRLNAIYELNKYPEPLELMAAIAESLPKDGSFVREWEMTDGRLKLLISSPSNVVGTRFVEAFDKLHLFDEIKIIPNADPKLIEFSMAILPVQFMERSSDVAAKRNPL